MNNSTFQSLPPAERKFWYSVWYYVGMIDSLFGTRTKGEG